MSLSFNQRIANKFLKVAHKVAPGFVNKKIIEAGFKVKPYRTSNEELDFLLNAKSKLHHLPITDESIYSYRWGEGPEIIIAHGWGARGVQFSKFIIPLVEKGYSVIAFDAPAHGDSDKKFSHVMEFIESLRVVSEDCKDVKAIMAHSMGCTSAVKVVTDMFNTSDTKLIWISGHLNLFTYIESWANRNGFPMDLMNNVVKSIEDRYQMKFLEVQTDSLMDKVKAETLLIHDKEDNRTDYRNALKLNETISNSHLHMTEGLGHFKILKAKEIVDRVVDFL